MPIEFPLDRWPKIKEDARRWWAGELERPLIHLRVWGRDPGRPEPALPMRHFAAFYDLSVPAEAIVDRWDYGLSGCRYLGDAFPAVWPNFGPGIAAVFFGGRLQATENTVWFHPTRKQELGELELHYDPENVWLRRIKDLCRAALARWGSQVQVAMTDLGGTLDVLATFRPGEKLLLDLLDHPDAVRRRTWEVHRLWWQAFDDLDFGLRPVNPGYTAWTPIFSSTPYYMLQCDLCYMLSPRMFDEFVRPELAASCRRLANPFYHLDGKGQLPHLDSLLSLPELKGVQWVPGEGQPGCAHWPEVYRKIRRAGKLIQVLGDLKTFEAVVAQLGSAKGLVLITDVKAEREDEARAVLRKYGVEE
jgi:5-methyltetrahydrofolate--homocysteine methyltransferase